MAVKKLNLDLIGIQKFIQTLASNSGLNVKYEAINQPRTDGHTIYLPKPVPSWSDEEKLLWEHSVYHELGHCDPALADAFELLKEKNIDCGGSLFGMVLNSIEDYRQEKYNIDMFEGRKQVLSKGGAIERQHIIDHHFSAPLPDAKEFAGNLLPALLSWDMSNREDWLPHMRGLAEQMDACLSDEMKKILKNLHTLDDEFNSMVTAQDAYNLTKKVIDEAGGDSEQEEQQAQAEPQEGEGEGKEGKEGDDEGKGKGKGDGEGDKRGQAAVAKYKDIIGHQHGSDGKSEYPLHIEYEEDDYHDSNKYVPEPYNEHNIMDYTTIPSSSDGSHLLSDINFSGLSSQVRKLLLIQSKSRFEYGKKRGKLHTKNIYRVTMK